MRRLTIAIPTYDREASLLRSLPVVLTQVAEFRHEVEVVLIDNASPKPVSEMVAPLLAEHDAVCVRVVRNRANVGLVGNILRCFETVETPYMWLLGDDDLIAPGALKTVLDGIDGDPEAAFHNYTYEAFDRAHPFCTVGLDEFVEKADSFATLLFMSIGVYRLDAFLPFLRFGYLYGYCWGPHLALVLASLGESGKVRFATEQLIAVNTIEDRKKYWSVLNVFMGIPVLTDLPMKPATRRRLGRFLGRQLQQEQLPFHLIENWKKDGDLDYALYTYDQISYRSYYFGATLTQRIKRFLYRLLVRFPRMGEWVIRTGYPLVARKLAKGKSIEQIDVPNRWGRV
jgi:glycosyltransferase involved in cell wall biosynthesis